MSDAKLSEPMAKFLNVLLNDPIPRTPGKGGNIPATSAALLRRGLAELTADGFIRITVDGVAAITPADESTGSLPKHLAPLVGKRVMAALVQDDKQVRYFTGRVLAEYLSAPVLGFRIPMLEVSDPFSAKRYSILRSHAVELAETTTEAKLQTAESVLDAELTREGVVLVSTAPVETEDPAPTYADDEFESYADYCGGLSWDELTREADRVEFVTPAAATKLYDRLEQKTMHVLGADVAGGLFVRYESDNAVIQRIDGKVLQCSPDFVAVCDHGYAVHDSCPSCDADDDAILSLVEHGTVLNDHIGNGRSIELGTVVAHADCTRSAINPLGDIVARRLIGNSWKAAHRALVLDHRMHARRLASIEQDERAHADDAPARQAEVDAELLGGDDLSAEILVRTLLSYGITTGAQFVSYVEKITAHDDRGTKTARSIRTDEMTVNPADVWNKPTMTAAEAFDVIDFTHPTLNEDQS